MAGMWALRQNRVKLTGIRMGYYGEQVFLNISTNVNVTVYTVPAGFIFALHNWGIFSGHGNATNATLEVWDAVPLRRGCIARGSSNVGEAGNGFGMATILPLELLPAWTVKVTTGAWCQGFIQGVVFDPVNYP